MAQVAPATSTPPSTASLQFRKPNPEDGAAVHALVAACAPLDPNSLYCNLLQCTHFRDTAILAERDGTLMGFISGYRLPEQPDTLFVWQVAVSAQARGQGLASRLLTELLARPQLSSVRHLHTSITPGNTASYRTFERLAQTLEAPLQERVMYDKELHFNGEHDTEMLVHIGPFETTRLSAASH